MDHLAEAYKTVRDATLNNPNISNAEAVGVIEVVGFEMKERMLAEIRHGAMNELSAVTDVLADRA